MKLQPEALEALNFFYAHDELLAEAVEDALDQLEADPTTADVKRHRAGAENRYIIDVRVPGRDENYWVVWEMLNAEPVVWHVGRARL